MIWDSRIAKLDHSSERVVRLNRHDARYDRYDDASFSTSSVPSEIDVDIVEELSNDEISSSVNLGFEVTNLLRLVFRIAMTFRIPSHAQTEIIAMLCSYVPHQISSMLKLFVGRYPVLVTSWWIASER